MVEVLKKICKLMIFFVVMPIWAYDQGTIVKLLQQKDLFLSTMHSIKQGAYDRCKGGCRVGLSCAQKVFQVPQVRLKAVYHSETGQQSVEITADRQALFDAGKSAALIFFM